MLSRVGNDTVAVVEDKLRQVVATVRVPERDDHIAARVDEADVVLLLDCRQSLRKDPRMAVDGRNDNLAGLGVDEAATLVLGEDRKRIVRGGDPIEIGALLEGLAGLLVLDGNKPLLVGLLHDAAIVLVLLDLGVLLGTTADKMSG